MRILDAELGIVGMDGYLRLVERLYACHGYENCCQCPDCLEREAHGHGPLEAAVCVCETPIVDDGDCLKCGRTAKS